MATSTLIGILLVMLYMIIFVTTDIKNKKITDIFDDEDFDK
jgi:hypothetical protein